MEIKRIMGAKVETILQDPCNRSSEVLNDDPPENKPYSTKHNQHQIAGWYKLHGRSLVCMENFDAAATVRRLGRATHLLA